jgi:hypothetical protein
MARKTIGIATILLLILVIGIGISRANPRVTRLQLQDAHDFTLDQFSDAHLERRLAHVGFVPVFEKRDNQRVTATVVDNLSRLTVVPDVLPDVLPDTLHTDLTSYQVRGRFGTLNFDAVEADRLVELYDFRSV